MMRYISIEKTIISMQTMHGLIHLYCDGLSRDQFCIFSDNFRGAVYKTYTRGASKNAKYCYLEAVFEAFWSVEIFLGR